MICPRCLLRAGSRGAAASLRAPSTAAARAFTTTRTLTAPTATAPQQAPAAATDSAKPAKAASSTSASPALVQSSVPAGTPLKGLNFLKNKTDPVALEDAEYPAWLWGVLKPEGKDAKDAEAAAEGDLFSKSKKQRRLAAKRLRKQALLNPDMLAPKVPVYEQSVDLPAGDGSVSGAVMSDQAREKLTKAMRAKRRSQIKEANFLKAMS